MHYGPTKPSVALANLQQLATLDGTAEYCLPDLAEVLRSYVHFDGFKMMWTDDSDREAAVWHVSPDMAAGSQSSVLFQRRFYNQIENEAVMASSALLRGGRIIDNCSRYGPGFYDSELYATILQPLGFRHALRLVLRGKDRPIGFLTLTRGEDEKPFSAEDERRLHAAVDTLTHAMARSTFEDETQLVPSTDSALVVADSEGRIRHLSDEARQFLGYIFSPRCSVFDLDRSFSSEARQWLLPLVRQTLKPSTRPGAMPVLFRKNQWGGFSARAYRMNPSENGAEDLVAITLNRHIPLALRLMRLADVRALPGREKAVCLKLAEGRSVLEIANELGMTVNTATGHVSSLYQRFGVNSRDRLMVGLMTAH